MISLLKITDNFANVFEDCQNFFFPASFVQGLGGELVKW